MLVFKDPLGAGKLQEKRGRGGVRRYGTVSFKKHRKIEIILTLGIELVNYYVLTSLCLEKIWKNQGWRRTLNMSPQIPTGVNGKHGCWELCHIGKLLARQINRVSSGCGLWKLRRRMKNAPTQKFYSNFDICPLASHLINCFTWKNHTWHNFTRVFSVPSCSRKQKSSSWRRWAFFHDYTPQKNQF